MRNIAIIGAGQAGLQLGIGLLKAGFNVSLYSNRTAKAILNGGILSSPSMFHSALQYERELGLNFWDGLCPQNTAVTYTLSQLNKAEISLYWQGKTFYPYQAIDQRLKFSRWIEAFIRLGGQFILRDIKVKDLNFISRKEDLTIVATGKGEISQLFSIESTRSIFNKPQRSLCCLYVTGMLPVAGSQGVRANVIPEIGEYFVTPGLTSTGPCEMMLFEGLPGGPFDCWQGLIDPTQRFEKALALLNKFIPWEAERCRNVSLADDRATLQGSYTPTVRKPILNLDSDESKPILGLGDTILLNDPIGGQGANSASKAAAFFLEKIKAQEGLPFTEDWMFSSSETYWEQTASWATQWTNLLLKPSRDLVNLFQAARNQPALANQLANAFDDPAKLLVAFSE